MHIGLLDILRCPFCGGHLELVTSHFHRADDTHITDGVIACECCTFPVVDGIPVMHLDAASSAARTQIEAGNTQAPQISMKHDRAGIKRRNVDADSFSDLTEPNRGSRIAALLLLKFLLLDCPHDGRQGDPASAMPAVFLQDDGGFTGVSGSWMILEDTPDSISQSRGIDIF